MVNSNSFSNWREKSQKLGFQTQFLTTWTTTKKIQKRFINSSECFHYDNFNCIAETFLLIRNDEYDWNDWNTDPQNRWANSGHIVWSRYIVKCSVTTNFCPQSVHVSDSICPSLSFSPSLYVLLCLSVRFSSWQNEWKHQRRIGHTHQTKDINKNRGNHNTNLLKMK